MRAYLEHQQTILTAGTTISSSFRTIPQQLGTELIKKKKFNSFKVFYNEYYETAVRGERVRINYWIRVPFWWKYDDCNHWYRGGTGIEVCLTLDGKY